MDQTEINEMVEAVTKLVEKIADDRRLAHVLRPNSCADCSGS